MTRNRARFRSSRQFANLSKAFTGQGPSSRFRGIPSLFPPLHHRFWAGAPAERRKATVNPNNRNNYRNNLITKDGAVAYAGHGGAAWWAGIISGPQPSPEVCGPEPSPAPAASAPCTSVLLGEPKRICSCLPDGLEAHEGVPSVRFWFLVRSVA